MPSNTSTKTQNPKQATIKNRIYFLDLNEHLKEKNIDFDLSQIHQDCSTLSQIRTETILDNKNILMAKEVLRLPLPTKQIDKNLFLEVFGHEGGKEENNEFELNQSKNSIFSHNSYSRPNRDKIAVS